MARKNRSPRSTGPQPRKPGGAADSLRFRSVADMVAWPATLHPGGAAILAVLFQLERSQWWSEAELHDQQLLQLSLLADHAYKTVPYYRRKLREAGAAGSSSETLTLLPLLLRSLRSWLRRLFGRE